MVMQKSTAFFTIGLVVTLLLGYYRFAMVGGPSVTSNNSPGSPSSNVRSGNNNKDGGGDKDDSGADYPPANKRPKGTVATGNTVDEVDAGVGSGSDGTGITFSPGLDATPERCVDVAHEDTSNVAILTIRMMKFKPNRNMWKRVWGDTPVFNHRRNADENDAAVQEPPAILKQWLYCYTHTYVNRSQDPENSDCIAEMVDIDAPVRGGKFFLESEQGNTCTVAPVFQGNVTKWEDLSPVLRQFPGPLKETERTLSSIAAGRAWLWKARPDPFALSCPTCWETKNLLHPTFVVGARRWFPLRKWATIATPASATSSTSATATTAAGGASEARTVKIQPYQCLVLMENGLRTTDMRRGEPQFQCTGFGEPAAGDVDKWTIQIPFTQIVDVAFHVGYMDDAFFAFTVQMRDGSLQTHILHPIRGVAGVMGIWTSLQMLYGYDIDTPSMSNVEPRGRALFSPTRPVWVRNITENITLARCSAFNMLNQYKHSVPLRCWTDIVAGTLTPSRQGKVTTLVPRFYVPPPQIIMAPHKLFPYLPCHPPYMTALVANARANHNMDQHGLYWPFSCNKISHRRQCLDAKIAARLRVTSDSPLRKKAASASGLAKDPSYILKNVKMSDLVRPRVAVCMAGFIRSFHLTRFSIFQNLVDPFNADFFAATWNLQGRVKKTDPVLKGHILNVERMRRRLINLIPKDRNVTRLIELGRYAVHVFSWNLNKPTLEDHKAAGWRHAGLYMLLSVALDMAKQHSNAYDVVIRGRFDLVPLVPLMIYPVWATPDPERRSSLLNANNNNNNNNNNLDDSVDPSVKRVESWLLDTGSACEMDGFWWPRTAILRQGVIVSHTADTRYKLFSWQYCDWLHIGTFETMSRLSQINNWAMENYIDSGAQFVEHVFAIDQGLRFYPMQLYLKILRETRKKPKPPRKNKPMRIRMHLFG